MSTSWRLRPTTLAIAGVLLGLVPAAGAWDAPPNGLPPSTTSTVVLYPVADTFVAEGAPTTNFGTEARLELRNLDGEIPDDRLSLVGFDLSSIPSDAVVTSAGLKLHPTEAGGEQIVPVTVRRAIEPWTEGDVTWSDRPKGVDVATIDLRDDAAVAAWTVTDLVQEHWVGRDFLQAGNLGLVLVGPRSGAYFVRRFASGEAKEGRPQLIVSYFVPTPTPTSVPARVDVWLVEGCGSTFAPGQPMNVRFRANVSDEVRIQDQPQGARLAQRAVLADRTYGLQAVAGQEEGARYIEASLLDAKVSARCDYRIRRPTATPTHTAVPSATPSPTARSTASPTPVPTSTSTPPAPCPDAYEPNDDFGTAASLEPLDPEGYLAYLCSPTDIDFYRFSADIADRIVVELTELPEDYDLELWDPNGDRVASSANAGLADERVELVVSNVAGEFRARVASASGGYRLDKAYRLRVEAATSLPPPLVVSATDDENDGSCDASHCSLREAIEAANAGASAELLFDIPESDPGFDGLVWRIRPGRPLPTIRRRLSLDAGSQTRNRGDSNPSGPEVVLDGSAVVMAGQGGRERLADRHQDPGHGFFVYDASSVTLRGFAIVNWEESGIHAERATQLGVYGNHIGIDAFGVTAAPNTDGITILGGHSAHIGGDAARDGNLISGNREDGIRLSGTAYAQVRGNVVGTDRRGEADVGNGRDGIRLTAAAEWNRIGGARDDAGNLISGNGGQGVHLDGPDVRYNELLGNRIGVDGDMAGALPNNGDGIRIHGGDHNTIGGVAAGMGNVVGGNIGVEGGRGVNLWDASFTTVAGNHIGVSPAGSADLGNRGEGVWVHDGAQLNVIGPLNHVENNTLAGVKVEGATATRNRITENRITGNGGPGIDNLHGGNEELPAPIVASADERGVQGAACPRCRVEVYGDLAGEGAELDGVVTATVTGAWSWTGAPALGPEHVTAITIDADGNTSEFSTCADAYEPNDTPDTAVELGGESELSAFICHLGDVDHYTFPVAARSMITTELSVPEPYRLRLYDPSGVQVAEASSEDLVTRTLAYEATSGGLFQVRIDGRDRDSSASRPYTLRVATAPLETRLAAWVDEGWDGGPEVYKPIPDAGEGPADGVWTDVVVDVTAIAAESLEAWVTLHVPDDGLGGLVQAYRRVCTSCELVPLTARGGGGTYWAPLWLSTSRRPLPNGQIVFRFYPRDIASPVTLDLRAEVSFSERGPSVGEVAVPPIHFVDFVPALILANRHKLYEMETNRRWAMELLASLTDAAQGPGHGPAGSMQAAIYYVDMYAAEARSWDNTTVDSSSSSAANATADIIDGLLEDWVEDAGSGGQNVLIVGDDELIPFYRKTDACTGDDTESRHGGVGDPAVDRAIAADFYFSDNWYADTNHSGASRGEIELNVGRIVGDTPQFLRTLFRNALAGPEHAAAPRAVLASWDHMDLHYGSASYASVLDHARDWGFAVNDDLVDNDGWTKADLLADLAAFDLSLVIFGTHGNPYGSTAPGYDDISGDEIRTGISPGAWALNPFFGYGDCRTGFSAVEDGMVDQVTRQGASGVVAGSGITWGFPAGTENYTEEVHNNFWRRVLSGAPEEVGRALRRAKADYSAGSYWSCRDEKGVVQMNLLGVPWMVVPEIGGSELVADQEDSTDEVSEAVEWSVPIPTSAGTAALAVAQAPRPSYVVTATLDASDYAIDVPAEGLELVTVAGIGQDLHAGVMLPEGEITLPLPPAASVEDVRVVLDRPRDLGARRLASYVPGVDLHPGGRPARWVETPQEVGRVPEASHDYELRQADGHLVLHVHVFPLSFDAVSGQTTLYERIEVAVTYATPAALAITDLSPNARHHAPTTLGAIEATVRNVSEESLTVTTTLRLQDGLGNEPSLAIGGPFELAPGDGLIAPAFVVPEQEGAYDAQLTLWVEGRAAARASTTVQVVAVQVQALSGPKRAAPGSRSSFWLSVESYLSETVEATVRLDMREIDGGPPIPVMERGASLRPGRTRIQLPMEIPPDVRGSLLASVTLTPDGHGVRRTSTTVEVSPLVYLPALRR